MAITLKFFSSGIAIEGLSPPYPFEYIPESGPYSPSGLAFCNSCGFFSTLPTGEYQNTTYICDSGGGGAMTQVNNAKYETANTAIINESGSVNLLTIPNGYSTLNVRFEDDSTFITASGKLYFFDGVDKARAPSGVTIYAAEIAHRSPTFVNNGIGDSTWTKFDSGTPGLYLDLISSPGSGGVNAASGSLIASRQHDNYFVISCSPDRPGYQRQAYLLVEAEVL